MRWLLLLAAWAGEDALTLEQALAQLADSPSVQAALADVDAARAGVLAARAVDNPQLRVGVDRLTQALEQPGGTVAVRVPIPRPWEEVGELRLARAEQAAAEGLAVLAHDEGARVVAVAFVDAWEATEVAHAHERAAERWRAVLAQVEARRGEGLADAVDVARAHADLARAEADARMAAGEGAAARASLLAVLGLSAGTLVDPGDAPLPESAAEAGDAAAARVQPWREAVEAGAAAEHLSARLSEVPWLDWLEAQAYGSDALELRAAVRLPLWAWGSGAAQEAAARVEAERARTAELQRALRAEVESAWHAVHGARQAWQTLQAAADEMDTAEQAASAFLAPMVGAEAADLAARAAEAHRVWRVTSWELAASIGLLNHHLR